MRRVKIPLKQSISQLHRETQKYPVHFTVWQHYEDDDGSGNDISRCRVVTESVWEHSEKIFRPVTDVLMEHIVLILETYSRTYRKYGRKYNKQQRMSVLKELQCQR